MGVRKRGSFGKPALMATATPSPNGYVQTLKENAVIGSQSTWDNFFSKRLNQSNPLFPRSWHAGGREDCGGLHYAKTG